MTAHLLEALGKVNHPRVLVVGDMILDRYMWGETARISPEAPTPVLELRHQESRPGGAGNVVNALAGLEAVVSCCGVVGDDPDGALLSKTLTSTCKGRCRLLLDRARPTTVKTRFAGYVQSARRAMQHMLRVDSEDTHPISAQLEEDLCRFVSEELSRQDVVLISDYDKGVFTPRVLRHVITECRRAGTRVIVDPRLSEDYAIYRGASLVTPNRYETQLATGIPIDSVKDINAAAKVLQERLELDAVIITLDRDGMFLYQAGSADGTLVPTQPREVYDVTGAGDMVASVLALMLGSGASYHQAAQIANVAAGLEVGKVGAAQVSRKEIVHELRAREHGPSAKVKPLCELLEALTEHRRRNETVVFTNGCFDILHIGHIEFLKFAARQGDLLVVALNSDSSVRDLKGAGRPILEQEDRASMLAALEDVDYVTLFEETTPEKLIMAVRPDVLVKGEDWRDKGVVGGEFVRSCGGKVVLAPLVKGVSTTDIVSRILERYNDEAKKPPDEENTG